MQPPFSVVLLVFEYTVGTTMATWHPDFSLGGWRVSPKLSRISKDGQSTSVKNKSMAVLVCLADAGGELLTRNEIMDGVWQGMEVTDDVLTQSIVELRKAFGDDARHPLIIETIPRVGFRLVADVKPVADEPSGSQPRRAMRSAIIIVSLVIAAWALTELWRTDRDPVIAVQDSPSIAILPFANLSDDSNIEYFSDGMSDEIRNLLGQIPGLKVIGRTSSHVFKGVDEDIRTIGQRLGVTSVLEGSVRMSGDRVRISTQLIDTSDGALIWSDSYDRTITDVFAVQEDVATRVIVALHVYVASRPTRGRPTSNPDAYALFLRARAAINSSDNRYAEDLLKQAVTLDAEFAEAYELLAFNYWMMAGWSIDAFAAQQLVSDSAVMAISLDPDLIFAKIYARTANLGPDYRKGTIEALDEAVRLQPDNPRVLESLSWLLVETGHLDESLKLVERYVSVEPLSLVARSYLALGYFSVGRNEDAFDAAQFVLRSKPTINYYTWNIVGMLLVEGHDEVAANYVESFLRQQGYPQTGWFRELVTEGRDPAAGQSYLDRRIAEVVDAMPDQELVNWNEELLSLYLFLGYLDRYYELVLETQPTDQTWHYAGIHAQRGVIFRQRGFTAHPDFLVLARLLSIDDVWEHRGAPDFCTKSVDMWVCE